MELQIPSETFVLHQVDLESDSSLTSDPSGLPSTLSLDKWEPSLCLDINKLASSTLESSSLSTKLLAPGDQSPESPSCVGVQPFGFYYDKSGELQEVVLVHVFNQNRMKMSVLTYGAQLYEIQAPDSEGFLENVLIGLPTLEDYRKACKGGTEVNWQHHLTESGVVMTHLFKIDDVRSVLVQARFELTPDNCVSATYSASSTHHVPFDISQRLELNLTGRRKEVLNHVLKLNASKYWSNSKTRKCPSLKPVDGTDFDFRTSKSLKPFLDSHPKGFNDVFEVIREPQLSFMCSLIDPRSRRVAEIYSDRRYLGLRTGKTHISVHPFTNLKGRRASWDSVRPGEPFHSRFLVRFGIHCGVVRIVETLGDPKTPEEPKEACQKVGFCCEFCKKLFSN